MMARRCRRDSCLVSASKSTGNEHGRVRARRRPPFLTSILFSLAGFINAIFARKFDDISIVPTFILTPLTFLGGVFYSIDLLPELWRQISLLNPVLYMVNAFRYGILGVSDIDLLTAFSVIIAFVIVLATISVLLLDRGVGIRT